MGEIVLVGLTCLDTVTVCNHFPVEDADVRADDYYWQCGGNAANSAVVLGQLGVKCHLMSCICESSPESDYIVRHLTRFGVNCNWCVPQSGFKIPTSTVIVNAQNGSRTILHYNRMPELTVAEFQNKVQLDQCAWIHFEGRRKNIEAIVEMMDFVCNCHNNITISVELEKMQRNLVTLIPKADVIFIGKDFARGCGYYDAVSAIEAFHPLARSSSQLICAWGEYGADAFGPNSIKVHSDAISLDKVVDTLGAGDTFNAGVIYSLKEGKPLLESISYGCKIAGAKCRQRGLIFEDVNMPIL